MEKEGVSGKNVENDGGKNHICVGCGNISPVKDRRQRSFGSWPTKKTKQKYKLSGSRNRHPETTMEQVKCCHDTDCNESMMKKGSMKKIKKPSGKR